MSVWPWEHLALGYLLYSGYRRARGRRPRGGPVLVLAFATQFPDLVDKPLAWSLGVLPGGTSLAHSALVAVPVLVVVAALAARLGVPAVGPAFAIGYLSHLLGDVLYPALTGGGLGGRFLLWPLVSAPAGDYSGVLVEFLQLWGDYLAFLLTPAGVTYLLFEVAFLSAALVVWVLDGRPGPGTVRRAVVAGVHSR